MEDLKEIQTLLSREQTLQKIRRMAFQILEENFEDKVIVIAGINGEGFQLAEALYAELKNIANKDLFLAKIILDKKAEKQPEINIECEIDTFKNKTVVLVDDVLNTGKTLAFSLRPFLSIPLKKLKVAVLVNRDYLQYPVRADYIGYSLSTTLKDHVKVVWRGSEEDGVYLY